MKIPTFSPSIRMDCNENPFASSPLLLQKLTSFSQKSLSTYPDKSELLKKLADYCQVDPACICISNGSDDLLRNIIEAYSDEFRPVLLPLPTFSMNLKYLQMRRAQVFYHTTPPNESFPIQTLVEKAKENQIKLLLLVNPNVPFGREISAQNLLYLLDSLPDLYLLIDEAYGEFISHTAVPWIKKYPRLIVCKTMSKAFGLAGLRIGYAISDPDNIQQIEKHLSPYSCSSLSCLLACHALEDVQWMKKAVSKILNEKAKLFEALCLQGWEPVPSSSNFISFFTPQAFQIQAFLKESFSILIRAFEKGFGLEERVIRISIGTPSENQLCIEALKQWRKITHEKK